MGLDEPYSSTVLISEKHSEMLNSSQFQLGGNSIANGAGDGAVVTWPIAGASVGLTDGAGVARVSFGAVGCNVGADVGFAVGFAVGNMEVLGSVVGACVGFLVSGFVGRMLGLVVGPGVDTAVGSIVGTRVGKTVGLPGGCGFGVGDSGEGPLPRVSTIVNSTCFPK